MNVNDIGLDTPRVALDGKKMVTQEDFLGQAVKPMRQQLAPRLPKGLGANAVVTDGERIVAIYGVRNPDELANIAG